MNFRYIKEDKEEVEIEIDNITITELLRNYLMKNDKVVMAAWKRRHPAESPILKIKTKGADVKKVLKEAVEKIDKELESILKEFKKVTK